MSTKQEHTPGPWRVAQTGTPTVAPSGITPDQKKTWDRLQADMKKPFRHNDGSFVIIAGAGDERTPVATATFQGHAKRGQAWNTEDPVGLANAYLVAAAPDLKRDRADLLAALENAIPMLETYCKGEPRAVMKLDTIRAAIAKAKA